MVISLVGIVWGMNYVRQGSVIKPMTVASAESKTPKGKPAPQEKAIKVTHDEASANDDNHLSWCNTRVKSLATKSGIKLEQDGTTWYSIAPQKKAINNLAMEKWLGKHCKLEIQDSRPPTFVPTKDVELLSVNFIDGETASFTLTPEGFYFWDGLRFRSKQFKEALDQLAKVANGEELK